MPNRFGLLLAAALLAGGLAAAQPPVVAGRSGLPTLAPLLEDVTPAVVNIAVITRAPLETTRSRATRFFRRFFNIPDKPRQQVSAGSGVIVDAARGLVLTNHHVIANADRVVVTLKDKRQIDAKVIGSDPRHRHRRAEDRGRTTSGRCASATRRACWWATSCSRSAPLRHRPDGDFRHRQRARAHRPDTGGLRGFHPDRRLDQSRQLRRRAGGPAGRTSSASTAPSSGRRAATSASASRCRPTWCGR